MTGAGIVKEAMVQWAAGKFVQTGGVFLVLRIHINRNDTSSIGRCNHVIVLATQHYYVARYSEEFPLRSESSLPSVHVRAIT
jgi:hypothetical protein